MTRNKLTLTPALLPLSYRGCRHLAYLLLIWIAGSFSLAYAAAPKTSVGTSAGAIRPSVIYHNYCSVCHGDKGDGKSRAQNSLNPPPKDFTSPAAAQVSRANMIDAVKNGRAGTAMTPWKSQLNQKEIEAVVDYVRNNFMMAAASSDNSRGRIVYSKNCSVCHGEKGDGKSRAQASLNPPPLDFTSPTATAKLTKERMITTVTFGRADTAMAGFKTQLSAEDINAVVDYIRTGFMANASTEGISGIRNSRDRSIPSAAAAPMAAPAPVSKPAVVNMAAPMPHGLKGDVTKGGAFYKDNCATCHGISGDGRGPRAYFINPKPRDFLHPASRNEFNRVELFEEISDGKLGTEMPAWRQVLSKQQIADVTEFVFQSFIRPPAGGATQAKAAK